MKTLDQIAIEHGTDKSSQCHNYTEKYEMFFGPLRDNPLKILEIGIQKGKSLIMWRDYFSIDSRIYGIDLNDCSFMNDYHNIYPIKGDQGDPVFLQWVNKRYGPFDIIIDDGSHHNSDMLTSFNTLFPLLAPGGYYVVEDLHACYWPLFDQGSNAFMDRLKDLLDCVNARGKRGVAGDGNDDFYNARNLGTMDWWEKAIESIYIANSIVFIKKSEVISDWEFPTWEPKWKKIWRRIKFLIKKIY